MAKQKKKDKAAKSRKKYNVSDDFFSFPEDERESSLSADEEEQNGRKSAGDSAKQVSASNAAQETFLGEDVSDEAESAEAEFSEAESDAESIDTESGDSPDCCRTKMRSPEEKKLLINRLNRIEGQVRGVSRMVEKDAYCIDVINQIAAVRSALSSLTKCLLDTHIRTCVVEDVQKGDNDSIDELLKTLQRLLR